MSKVIKGIRKVFKKVAKVVKKIAPIALAAAAIYFTVGGAAGATAGSSLTGSLGLTGTLGGVVSGAVTQAGYGSLIGGALSKAQGGSFADGAKAGAIGGALTGGITGGMNPAGAGVQPTGGVQTPTAGVDPAATAPSVDTSAMSAADEAKALGMNNFSHSAPPPNTSGGGLLSKGGWLERNQALTGNIIAGIGQGLMARGAGDAEIDAMRERQKIIGENYAGAKPGAGYKSLAPTTTGQRPNERFNPDSYSSYEYAYNSQTGRIERVPV